VRVSGARRAVSVHAPADVGARRDSAARVARQDVERPNVVLITLDTTRADRLHCYSHARAMTPALDALAARGVLFAGAAAPAPLMLPSHCSIMTGLYPTYHGVRLNGTTALSQSQTTLAEVFRGRGYDTAAFIAAFVLDGPWGLNQGFGTYDDQFDMSKFKHLDLAGVQRPGNEVIDATLGWLERHRSAPFFVECTCTIRTVRTILPSRSARGWPAADLKGCTTARSRLPTSRLAASRPGFERPAWVRAR
jgi:hypothetical protein